MAGSIYITALIAALATLVRSAPLSELAMSPMLSKKLASLSSGAQRVALQDFREMGSFDAQRTFLGHSGKFYFTEDAASSSGKESRRSVPSEPLAATQLTPEGIIAVCFILNRRGSYPPYVARSFSGDIFELSWQGYPRLVLEYRLQKPKIHRTSIQCRWQPRTIIF